MCYLSMINKHFGGGKKFLKAIQKKFRYINPDLRKTKIWDIFLVILSFLNFFLLSLEICFFIDENETTFSSYFFIHFIKITNILCYGVDIFLNFFTGFYHKGSMVIDLKLIRRNYFSELFFFDLLAYIPIISYVFESSFIHFSKKYFIINILFFFIIKKYNKKLKILKEFLIQEKESFENVFSILILYLRILFIAHIFACFWYLLGTYYDDKNTWITTYKLGFTQWSNKYVSSLYWSLVTMVTVGYGDIVPQNNAEKIYCIITMLIGFTVFGFTLGSLGDIIHKMNENDQELWYFLFN